MESHPPPTQSPQLPRISFSVATKLLISVVAILTAIIVFQNGSAIFLLREDKRAYTYETNSTAAVLAGSQFSTIVAHELDTLRLSLASFDPTKPASPEAQARLKSVVENQTDLLSVDVVLARQDTGQLLPVARASREKELGELKLAAKELELPAEAVKAVLPDLLKNSFAFLNLTRPGEPAVIGVLVADLKLASNPGGLPIALGLASFKAFGAQLASVKLTIATQTGWVIFDTDPAALAAKKNITDDPFFKTAAASKLATGAQEYDDQEVHWLGSYSQPGFDLLVFTKTEWKKALRATYALIQDFLLIGSIAIGLAIVFAIFFSKTLTRPINRLYQATVEVAKGNFDLELTSSKSFFGRDEINALTGSFGLMSRRINELIKEQAAKIHLENELNIASTVQQTLIPPAEFDHPKLLIHSHYQAAATCGGDWWGFFGVGPKLCIMIADATGHGISSALITASARSCFSVMHKLAQMDPDFTFSPSAMLEFANRVIYDAAASEIMMTFFCCTIDFEEMTLTFSNAGHNPPYVFKKDGKVVPLVALGKRLGEVRELEEAFEEKTIPVERGDTLFLYTDGLIEGKNLADEMYGKKRMRKLIEATLAQGPAAIVSALVTDFMGYNEGKQLDDDLTIAVAEFK